MNEAQKNESAEEMKGEAMPDLSLIFAPSWARQSPEEVTRQAARHARSEADSDGGSQHRSYDSRGQMRSPRPPRREGGFGDRRGPSSGGGRSEDRPDLRSQQAYAPQPEAQKPLSLDVRFLPEQKALSTIIRRIQTSRRAYPIRDIVRLFQNSDEGMLVRIEGLKESEEPIQLFQCRVCGMPAMSEAEVRDHLLRQHLENFYEVEEVEGEAPGGSFSCVARCGLSGELLGPPNHHSFGIRVQEMLRERYPKMTGEEYRSRIEMVREPEVVEAWREANRRQKLYRRKTEAVEATPAEKPEGAEAPPPAATDGGEAAAVEAPAAEPAPRAPAVERHIAELQFNREIVPQQIGSAKHLVCPATALKNLPNRRLAALLSERFDEETRRHGSLFFAVHGAFRHRGLYFFRAGDARGPEFVMGSTPLPLDTTHVVAKISQIIAFVTANPSCPPQSLFEALAPNADEAIRADLATQIKWLVEKGHLIEYFNGMLTLPVEHPIFRPHGKAPKADAEEKTAPAAKADATASKRAGAKSRGAPAAAAAADASAEPAPAVAVPAPGEAEEAAAGDVTQASEPNVAGESVPAAPEAVAATPDA
jgi:hypothetical protein